MTQSNARALSEAAFRAAIVIAICVAGLLAYANSFSNDFVWDDVSSVLLHKHVQDPSKFFQLFREDQHAFGRGQGNFYRPLVAASFMLDFALANGPPQSGAPDSGVPDVKPFVFHLTSTLWHVAAALLLLALLTRLDAPRFVRAAVPLVYVTHPLHTEAVAYISGRADSMSAVFIIAALWFALWEGNAARRVAGTTLSALSYCGALLSKESGTMFPFLLLLVIVLRPGDRNGDSRRANPGRLIPLAVSAALLAGYIALRMTVFRFVQVESPDSPLGQRLVETGQAFAEYARLLFIPSGLHMERTLAGVPAWVAAVGWLLLAGLVAAFAASAWRGQRRAAMGVGWFLVTWFPISGLIPLNAPMAEHWMYVPMAGFFWALAEWAWVLIEPRRTCWPAFAAVYCMCVAFIAVTIDRNDDWRDNEAIYRATLAKNPQSLRVHYNLAVTYGDIVGNLSGARRHYEAVLALYKNQREALASAGMGQATWTEELETHLSLGDIFFEQQRYDMAGRHYEAALRSAGAREEFRPLAAMAAAGMGRCCLAFGDTAQAAEYFKRASHARPDAGTTGPEGAT